MERMRVLDCLRLYKCQLRMFCYELELDNLRSLKGRTQFIWGHYFGGVMFIFCMLSIQWIRFLSFCAKGGHA